VIQSKIVPGILSLLGRLPLPILYILASAIAWVLCRSQSRAKKITQRNLEACFPQISTEDRQKLQDQSLAEMAKTGVEMLYFWQCSQKKLRQCVSRIQGQEAFELAKKQGKGVLLLGPHLGAWELVNLYFSPMTAMYDPPKFLGLEHLMKSARQRFGSTLVPADRAGVKALFRALGRGEVVGLLPDQDPGHEVGSGFAHFFGVPALTMTLPIRLVQKKKIPSFYAFAERHAGGGFVLHFIPVNNEFYDEREDLALRALNAGIEKCIEYCPAQYQWSYKRFKRRPEGRGDFYA